jgi:hypothetical protein
MYHLSLTRDMMYVVNNGVMKTKIITSMAWWKRRLININRALKPLTLPQQGVKDVIER